MELEELQNEVKKVLSEERYYHSICVMNKCGELASVYNVDVEMAKKVGIIHDIAKEMPKHEKLEYVRMHNIKTDELEEKHTTLLHAKIGADIAVKRFGFTEEMGKAIEAHTTGKPDMGILAKILYIADWVGEDRDYPETPYLCKLAEEDLDAAIIYALEQTIKEKLQKEEEIHEDSILTLNELLKNGG